MSGSMKPINVNDIVKLSNEQIKAGIMILEKELDIAIDLLLESNVCPPIINKPNKYCDFKIARDCKTCWKDSLRIMAIE